MNILFKRPKPFALISGPIFVSSPSITRVPSAASLWAETQNAMRSFERGSNRYGFVAGKWRVEARPVRASEQPCLRCHKTDYSYTYSVTDKGVPFYSIEPKGNVIKARRHARRATLPLQGAALTRAPRTMKITFKRLDHVQVCIPRGAETEAREFYGGLLGLEEIEKPAALKENGGMWYAVADVQLHVGVEERVAPSKRHPAFEVENIEAVRAFLEQSGVRTKDEPDIPGVVQRFSLYDPFGNRIELLEKSEG